MRAPTAGDADRIPLPLRVDVLAGAIVCGLAALIWIGASPLAVGALRNFGPGFLPRICAAALLAGGLALLYRGISQPDAAAERLVLAGRGPLLVGLAILVFAVTIRGLASGPLPVPRLGLLVAGPVTVLIAGLGSIEARPRELVAYSLGLSGVASLVFVDMLGVPLPVLPGFMDGVLPLGWGPDWPGRVAALLWLAAGAALWRLFGLHAAAGTAGRPGDGA